MRSLFFFLLKYPISAINDGSPPFRCPDCKHHSYTPIDFFTHLGSDHLILAHDEEDSFVMNKTIFTPNALLCEEDLRLRNQIENRMATEPEFMQICNTEVQEEITEVLTLHCHLCEYSS